MVSGCTEVEGYKPKLILSSVTKKWFISVHVYIYMYVFSDSIHHENSNMCPCHK